MILESVIWDRFENTMKLRAPRDYGALNPPAGADQIAAAERELKLRFPKELKAAYLRHNGVSHNAPDWICGPFQECYWCTIDQMVADWKDRRMFAEAHDDGSDGIYSPEVWAKLDVRPEFHNKKWLPIALSNTTTRYFVDLAPGPLGTRGQIIRDSGMREPHVIAPSLNAWLDFVTRSFESGRFVIEEGSGMWRDTHGQLFRYSPATADGPAPGSMIQ